MGKSSRFLVSIKVFLYALVLSLISKGIYTNTDININDEKVIEEPSDTSFSDILLSIILPPTRIAYAAPPSSPYTAGETLDPSCSPGDTNCSVDHDPQGSAGNIQYNNYGLFGASSDLTYATTTGNFGIGTSSPYAKLSVTGQIVANYFTATSTTATSTLAGALKFSTSGWGIEFADGTIQTTAATGGGSGQDHTFPFVAASGWASSVSTSTPVIFTGGIGTTATSTFNATTTFGSRVYQTGLGESTFFGYQAGENDDLTSNNNTAFGYQALTANTSGIRNTAVGYQSLMSNTTGSFNTASGYHALKSNTTGCSNIAIGNNSLKSNTTGCSNIAIGHGALCLNTEARGNTAVGNCALLANTTGCFNTASGGFALGGNTEGFRNSTFGYQALCKNTTGCDNIAVGFQSADNLTTGSNNIFIGHNIDAQSATASNQLSIGNLLFSNGIDGTGTSLSSGNLGIGTTTPGSKLSVAGDSFISGTSTAAALELHGQNTGIRFSDGTYQTTAASASPDDVFDVSSNLVSNTGTGSDVTADDFVFGSTQLDDTGNASHDNRMFFDKSTGAFRAGCANSTQWDSGSRGNQSAAFGYANTASGTLSFAAGCGSTASGCTSIALGKGVQATNTGSVALGQSTCATGAIAFAAGATAKATGVESVALGSLSVSCGTRTLAIGFRNTASGSYASSIGSGCVTVSGACSFGLGLDHSARTISQASTFAVLGGKVGFGTTTPTQEFELLGDSFISGTSTAAALELHGQNTGIRFSDGTYQTTAASAGGGADNIFDVTSNVVSNTGSDATVGTDDFVFGSTGLDDTGDTSHDSRFFFDKSKGAFRAGVTLTDEWDDANVGACSVAFGKQTCASGDYSAAFGLSTVASGARSTAFGSGSDATGGESVAFGVDTLASGNFAASFGCKSCATATAAASFGLCTDATGNYSFTTGRNTTASGTYSVALGGFSSAQGNSAFAAGGSNHACADNSVALGKKVTVTGACSTGIGLDNTARTISQTSTFAVLGGVAGFGTTTPQSELSVEGSILSSDLYGGATTLSVDANGNIIRTPSDERLKTNITPITNALEKVLSLNGVYYNWKDTNRFGSEREIGFIAQEVEDVVPEVVKSGGEYKSLNYQVLTALLAGAVQELSGYFDILGFKIVDGAAWFTQIYTERLVVGTPENPTGIILYDEDTGKPYCLTIVSGQVRTRSGNCDEGEEVEHTTTYHNGDYSQETIYEEEVVDEQATSTQETVNEEEPLLEEVNEEEVIEEPEEKEEVIIDEAEQEVEEVNEEEVIEEEEATPEEEVIGTEESESSEETPTE